jgi:hypothetical protein
MQGAMLGRAPHSPSFLATDQHCRAGPHWEQWQVVTAVPLQFGIAVPAQALRGRGHALNPKPPYQTLKL